MTTGKISLGKAGEDEAVRFLKKQGYKVLERNYRCALGELDLIAKDKNTIIFVEVKTRTSDAYGSPLCAVDGRKQRKIAAVAANYLSLKNLNDSLVRFDVIAVESQAGALAIEHFKDAFEAPER